VIWGTTIRNLSLKAVISSARRALPPRRAAATRTFTTVRLHSPAGLTPQEIESRNPQPAPSNSDPELTEKPEASQMHLPSKWRLIVSVFLPFAAGYFLSFLFRTINASISSALGVVSPPV
jgi:hypothetical protein